MDNFKIDLVAEGDESLIQALDMAFRHNAAGGKASHYRVVKLRPATRYYANDATEHLPANLPSVIPPQHVHHFTEEQEHPDGVPTLILYWTKEKDSVSLGYPMKVKNAIEFVKGWLESEIATLPRPDIDGSCRPGWRVFVEDWGHVLHSSYAIIAVQPSYAMYGK